MSFRERGRLAGRLLLTMGLLSAGTAYPSKAGEYQVTPTFDAQGEYNSNVFMSATDRRSAIITTLSPGLELSKRNEILDAALSNRFSWLRYSDEVHRDTVDHAHQGAVRHSLSPRLSVSGSALFARESRTDRDLQATGIINTSLGPRNRQAYSLGGAYAISELTRASLSGSFNRDDYSNPLLVGSETHGGTLGVDHDLRGVLENIRGRAGLTYTEYLFPGSRQENASATVGVTRELAEKWGVSADFGGRLTKAETETRGWVGQVGGSYRGERNSANLSFSRDLSTASGAAGLTLRNAVTLTVARAITEEIAGSCYAAYFRNRTDSTGSGTVPFLERTLEVRPSLSWRVFKDVSVQGSWSYVRIKSGQPAQLVTADRNVFLLLLAARHEMFE
ncbi:MAG: outer membrane beta-barrel protein [Candidatus Deferrimicrobium sp.]